MLPLNETTYDISRFIDPLNMEGLPSSTRRLGAFDALNPAIQTDAVSGVPVVEGLRSTVPTLIDGSLATDLFHLQNAARTVGCRSMPSWRRK